LQRFVHQRLHGDGAGDPWVSPCNLNVCESSALIIKPLVVTHPSYQNPRNHY
jgi:hypothetical protein